MFDEEYDRRDWSDHLPSKRQADSAAIIVYAVIGLLIGAVIAFGVIGA